MKKRAFPEEGLYLLAIVLMAFSVAMLTAADFGISMIVAPAYLLSQKFTFLTFGQSEYVLQAVVFVAFCLLMKRVKVVYFSSFLTCLIYGAVLDGWRAIIPLFNPAVTEPGSMALPLRVGMFVVGVVLTSLSVAMFFRSYLYPQVYDFFVKGISGRFSLSLNRFKQAFDLGCLAVSVAMSLLLFGKFVGVGVGTLIMACVNGVLIGWFSRLLDRFVKTEPWCKPLANRLVEV